MPTLTLLILALVLALIAGVFFSNPPNQPMWNRLIAFALAAWLLSIVLGSAPVVHHLAP